MRAVDAILGDLGLADARAEPLDGGFSNETYRVTDAGGVSVLRLNGDQLDHLGLRRVDEVAAIRAAARAGIGPTVLADADDFLLTALVPGRLVTADEARQAGTIEAFARALRQVHAIEGVERSCDPFWLVRTYVEGVRRLGHPLPDGLDEVLRHLGEVEDRAARRGDPVAYCHNDFYPFNVITDGERLTVLDWELSGTGNVYFDLATLSSHLAYTPGQDQVLLSAYFGACTGEHVAALHDLKYVAMAREVAWALLHAALDAASGAGHVNHSHDYEATARWFLGRLLNGHVTT